MFKALQLNVFLSGLCFLVATEKQEKMYTIV